MKRFLLKLLFAFVSAMLCIVLLSEFTVPKWIRGNNPQTYQIDGFSKLEPNTLDVLVLGSCQSYNGFNPAVLYERSGLTSYVLASPDQRFYTTYHYLKYALKTQSPKTVLIDTLMLTELNDAAKGYDSKALYSLKDLRSRLEFSNDIFEFHYTKAKTIPQYYFNRCVNLLKTAFPVFAFCSTFDFSSDYFKYYFEEDNITYNGSTPMYVHLDMSEKSEYMTENCNGEAKIDPDADTYFKKIVDLCSENGIKIILYKTVSPKYWSNEKHKAVADYAANFGFDYIDFNDDFSSFGFDLSQHFYERWKLNADGMRLTTELLSDFITKTYPEISSGNKSEAVTAYYDSLLERYEHAYENAKWETVRFEKL